MRVPPARVFHNCSGKHAGMIATCRLRQWEVNSYLQPSHPLQQANHDTLARFVQASSAIPTGVDGCGVPTFFLTLRAMATAFARLANPESLDVSHQPICRRVVTAMTRHPYLVAGTRRLDTQIGEFAGERLVIKGGAEGLVCVGLVGRGLGLVVRIADGSHRCQGTILCRLLAKLLPDLDWNELESRLQPPLRNSRGEVVGTIEARVT